MNEFFQFEADFVESLRCIPMQVRYKLDTCGVKLKLSHWTQFSATERQALVEKPCSPEEMVAYREFLQQLVQQHTGNAAGELPIDSHPAWLNSTAIPQDLLAKAKEVGTTITLQQWQLLTPLQRFALIKLSRPSHENKNFVPALQEFHLV
ncbi:nitrate reductase associated protein [Gloeocapsopsis crepidinum LEGE 06123]|uniref:Nitrate reductase associated protein n=1 Tax=Gloeocapsopsis crepidinum LEGE 06123 TaxID=588587 RepID=A0ABR9URB2_9CHRO|nr:nitrate reductase associated protein [Gloeocapsopsis crepidinum]MBE9190830.1 nitrate reductase associated protein [Gloeocapsopsis crepidinum LEGE 06123]